ncbi:uncharacterized protein C15orf39 homolog isoform X2 [Gadus macrocephalus]|uniref:uncharacterized protein C15orf39 homolog isoform X2 n=1 Tax=Gadus macrocephalus TaxID=80720 RepID=UPI0028CB31E3|nr:uncharacterized protein C15orf39 homolog isoform X2 [Gadus macrocephalus]
MMESQRAPSLKDPAAQSKMLLFEETPVGAMPGFLGPRGQKYPVPYYAYDPREKDEAGLILAWSGPSAGLTEGRSAVSHQSGMRGNSHSVYQPYKKTFSPEECHSRSPSVCGTPGKPVSSQYARSPDMSSPLACSSTSVINQTAGRSSASQSPQTSMHLAIPKAVYGQRPCCSERGCVLGQRYGVEHVTQRVPSAVHESDWMNTGAHYSRPSPIHRTAPESSLQQKGTHFEHGGERPLPKDSNGGKYQNLGACRARTIPGYFESPFSSYPCIPTHALFGSLTPQNLQTPPNGYHGLLPAHPHPFEHMTSTQHRLPSQVCQEPSPMSKYGHLPQHHGFYYPEENLRMEGASVCKNIEKMHRESASAFSNHLFKNVQEHRLLYQPDHGDTSMINSVAMPNPSFFRGLDPRYPVPRVHMTASQVRGSPKEQHTPLLYHTNGLTTSPVGQPHGSPVYLHSDSGSARSHDKPRGSPLNMHVEAKRPSGHVEKLYLSPGRLPRNKVPHNSPHGERFSTPPTIAPDRPLDYSCHKVHVITSKQSKDHTDPTAVQMSPTHYGERIHKVYSHGHNRASTTDTSSLVTNEDHGTSPSCFCTTAFKGKLKRSNSQVPNDFTTRPIKFEKCDSPDEELLIKRQKLELEGDLMKNDNSTDHHPMPIIDNVFSLAPYRALLQASGMLLSSKRLWSIDQCTKPCEDKTDPSIQDKGPREEAEPPYDGPVPKELLFSNATTVKPTSDLIEQKAMKVEKQELETNDCVNSHSKVISADCSKAAVKGEAAEVSIPDTGPMFVIKKCEPEEFDITPPNEVLDETSKTCHTTPDVGLESSHQEDVQPPPVQLEALSETSSKSTTPAVQSEDTLGTQSTPQFTISKYKLIVPDTHGIASRRSIEKPALPSNMVEVNIQPIVEVHKPPVQPIVVVNKPLPLPELVAEFKHPPPQQTPPIHVRERFLKLHHCLCNLVTEVVSVSPEQALRDWICQVEKVNSALSANKNHRISCLPAVEAGQAWLNVQIQLALDKVLLRIEEYISQEQCPFPHVMRTGAVFIPMMVVKKLLFPQVQGGHIDQVLQNRKVELRPTTLSEEKHLTQLHRQAFSSKLRRLMSLKHLPRIYTDVLNLFHHACVSKRLGVKLDGFLKTELEDRSEDPEGLNTPAYIKVFTAPPFPGSNRQMHPQQEGETLYPIKRKSKSRVKRCSRQAFLDYRSSSPNIEVENKEQERNWDDVNSLGETKTDVQNGQEGSVRVEALVGSPGSKENTWTCPLSSDELSTSSSDMEMEGSSIPSLVNPALDSVKDFSPTRAKNGERLKARKPGGKKDRFLGRSTKVPNWNQRREGFSRALRSLSGSRRRSRSRLKIQYCPYLSACHSAEHRRRWVLRSAVQRAQGAIKFCYPDLVGKKILHLYEEDDKSEVWYRGDVVSIHEAHPNPLKNVFEVKYDSEPEWTYFLELLMDFKKGWLKIAE